MLTVTNTHIFIGLIVAWSVILYFYWRSLRSLYPNSRFRAYDMLMLTLIVMLVIGRAIAVIGDAAYYFGTNDNLLFLSIWDLNLNYLAFVFIPLITYQFEIFNIEHRASWKNSAMQFVLFGSLLVLAVEISQIGRALVSAWPQELMIYHLIQSVILLAVVGLILFQTRRGKQLLPVQLILLILPLATIILNLSLPVLNDAELKATIVSQTLLASMTLIPFLSLPERRSQIKRPNPGDFRAL